MIIVRCLVCDSEFKTFLSRIKDGRGKYCSKKCASVTYFKKGQHPSSKTEIKKGQRLSPKTEFEKGHSTWNRGMKGRQAWMNLNGLEKGRGLRGEKSPQFGRFGELHYNWKGGAENTKILKKRRRAQERGATGSHTAKEWESLKKSFNYECLSCNKIEPYIILTEDHIIPISVGGSDNIDNIQPLCRPCNSKKRTKTIDYRLRNFKYSNGII